MTPSENSQNLSTDLLFSTTRLLSAARTIDHIAKIVTHVARQALQCDGVTFVLRDGELCHYFDEQAISPLWKGQKFQLRLCISGWAMIHQQAVAIEDIAVDPRIPFDAYRPTFVKSLTMTPVIADDSIAAIGCYWQQHHAASKDECRFIRSLADAVSVAMQNVQLYDQLNARIAELKKANQSKDEFLMTVSHELRTPLSVVLGWTHILLSNDLPSSEHVEGLKVIDRNAQALLGRVEDLLNASGIVMGKFEIKTTPLDPIELAFSALQAMRPLAQEKAVHVEFRSSARFGHILADAARLQLVLTSLYSNALKFTQPGGKLVVTVKRRGPSALVEIADTGCGIEPDFLPQVFNRFAQADSSTTREYGGLGLGLAISKSIVEAHNGTLQVHSDGKNKGTTVSLHLPLERIMGTSSIENDELETVSFPPVSTTSHVLKSYARQKARK